MSDTNKSRARLRQRVVYLLPEDDARLARVLDVSGETFSAIVRRALRRALPQIERELGIYIKGSER